MVTLRGVRVIFVPPRLSEKHDTISLKEGTFMANLCRQQQYNLMVFSFIVSKVNLTLEQATK